MFRRNPRRVHAAVDERTCRTAERDARQLLDSPDPADWAWARAALATITSWLDQQARTGRASRREQQAERLRHWHQQHALLNERLGIPPPPEPPALHLRELRGNGHENNSHAE